MRLLETLSFKIKCTCSILHTCLAFKAFQKRKVQNFPSLSTHLILEESQEGTETRTIKPKFFLNFLIFCTINFGYCGLETFNLWLKTNKSWKCTFLLQKLCSHIIWQMKKRPLPPKRCEIRPKREQGFLESLQGPLVCTSGHFWQRRTLGCSQQHPVILWGPVRWTLKESAITTVCWASLTSLRQEKIEASPAWATLHYNPFKSSISPSRTFPSGWNLSAQLSL